jgi:hypothetical protein
MKFNSRVTGVCTQEPACAGESIINFHSNEDTPLLTAGFFIGRESGLPLPVAPRRKGGTPGPLIIKVNAVALARPLA